MFRLRAVDVSEPVPRPKRELRVDDRKVASRPLSIDDRSAASGPFPLAPYLQLFSVLDVELGHLGRRAADLARNIFGTLGEHGRGRPWDDVNINTMDEDYASPQHQSVNGNPSRSQHYPECWHLKTQSVG